MFLCLYLHLRGKIHCMKFIKTMVAFLFLYSFVALIGITLVLSYWLSLFTPDNPAHVVAKVDVSAIEETSASFDYTGNTESNALTTVITRGVESPGFSGPAVLSARSTVLIATFDKVSLSEQLVPLGFKTLYRLRDVRDATGKEIYVRKNSFIDDVLFKFATDFLKLESEHVSLVAYDKDVKYTITAFEEKLFVSKIDEVE